MQFYTDLFRNTVLMSTAHETSVRYLANTLDGIYNALDDHKDPALRKPLGKKRMDGIEFDWCIHSKIINGPKNLDTDFQIIFLDKPAGILRYWQCLNMAKALVAKYISVPQGEGAAGGSAAGPVAIPAPCVEDSGAGAGAAADKSKEELEFERLTAELGVAAGKTARALSRVAILQDQLRAAGAAHDQAKKEEKKIHDSLTIAANALERKRKRDNETEDDDEDA